MKKIKHFLIVCLFTLPFIGGCSDHNTADKSVNELGNFISFKKTGKAEEVQLVNNIEINVTGWEQGKQLIVSKNENEIIFADGDGELLAVIVTINNQSDFDIDINNFLKCKEGTVFTVDEDSYPAVNFFIENEKDNDGKIMPNEEKTIFIYTEVPAGTVTSQSLIEVYLTYGKESKPSCAVKKDDLNTDATKNGFHYQLQWSALADDMW